MKLSPQQVAAAKARGFVLFPATQGQIDRMTMQRRVFDVDGRPHVVSRDGLYFETHATLAPVIADAENFAVPEPTPAASPAPAPAAAVVATPTSPVPAAAPSPAPAEVAAPEPAPAVAEAAADQAGDPAGDPGEEAPARAPRRRLAAKPAAEGDTRKPTRRRTMVERAEELFSPPPPPEPGHVATEHTLSLPVDDSAQGTEAAARRRQRVADAPRWQVAGAIRRGRQPRAT